MKNVSIPFNRTNFHAHTFCEFREVDVLPESINKPNFQSKSGSTYYFTEEGVYRSSNHWGRAANCRWRLISQSIAKVNNSQTRIGFAKWTDFYPNNDTDALFYIVVDFETTSEITVQQNEQILKNKPGIKLMNDNFNQNYPINEKAKKATESEAKKAASL
jgi:hypothetical protein